MIEPLIPKEQFIGLNNVINLATGGESPMLKSHQDVITQFMRDKGAGETARDKEQNVMVRAQQKCAELFSVDARDITFLSSASEGINNVTYGLDWQPGDNVVVADVEFPSDVLPWTRLEDRGVELRIVEHDNWFISLEDIAAKIDHRTRVVAISHVSMFTGQRVNLIGLSRLVRSSNALLLLDATHAAGVVSVEASYADIMVSSCYKWMLGVHGAAVFYWNRERLPNFQPPFIGWNSVARSGGWKDPSAFTLHESADRFLPGNPGFISIYILDNALDHLLSLGAQKIEQHALALSNIALQGIKQLGWELMTPEDDQDRAGNVCFMAPDVNALREALDRKNILVWGAYANFGRVRISTHLHNDSQDVERCIAAIQEIQGTATAA